MKELAIGEEIRIRCVEDYDNESCGRCVLFNGCACDFPCDKENRFDHKDVHFERVEATEPSVPTRLTTNQKIDIVNQFYTCQDKWVAKRTIEMIEEMLNQKEKDNGK